MGRGSLRNVDEVKCRASLAWDDPFAARYDTEAAIVLMGVLLLIEFAAQGN